MSKEYHKCAQERGCKGLKKGVSGYHKCAREKACKKADRIKPAANIISKKDDRKKEVSRIVSKIKQRNAKRKKLIKKNPLKYQWDFDSRGHEVITKMSGAEYKKALAECKKYAKFEKIYKDWIALRRTVKQVKNHDSERDGSYSLNAMKSAMKKKGHTLELYKEFMKIRGRLPSALVRGLCPKPKK